MIYDDDGANGDRDALGRITKKTEWIVEGDTPDPGGAPRPLASRTYDYGYNPEGRPWLESVAVDGTVVSSYGYDDNGNRTSADLAWSQLGYDESFDYSLTEADTVYDSADRLLAYGSKSYSWNNFGQLQSMTDSDPNGDGDTSDAESTFYQYDLYGNLLRVDLPDGRAIEYDVDGAGRRVGRRELDPQGNEISFRGWIYRDLLRPIAEVNAQGDVVARYVYEDLPGPRDDPRHILGKLGGANSTLPYQDWAPPSSIEILDASGAVQQTLLLTTNQVNSVQLVTDAATGHVVQRIEYDEFGKVRYDSNPAIQAFGFGGGLFDSATELVRFGVRDYAPDIGRWTSRDPIRSTGGANHYLYAWGQPISILDPTGFTPKIPKGAPGLICDLVTGADCPVPGPLDFIWDPFDLDQYRRDSDNFTQCLVIQSQGYDCCQDDPWSSPYPCPPDNDTNCDPRWQSCEDQCYEGQY